MNLFQPKIVNVVAFGGGTGLSQLLSGLKDNPWLKISAIVNMFDNGGSSGVLRDEFGILPPGDILKCLVALSPHELIARQILLTRISDPVKPGHNAGNAVLLAFEQMYGQDYFQAVKALSQLLGIKGEVIPVCTSTSTLVADVRGDVAIGEVNVDRAIFGGDEVLKLYLDPQVDAFERAIGAIEKADIIVIGPGSFFTSILPTFLPSGISEAIRGSKAKIIFVANLVREGLGMSKFTIDTYLELLRQYTGRLPEMCVVNSTVAPDQVAMEYLQEGKTWLYSTESVFPTMVVNAPLWHEEIQIARHDRERLAYLLMGLIAKLMH